ncbi:MAG: hypothetical protein WCF85_11405 [Rhodospirillaceae bacterium]
MAANSELWIAYAGEQLTGKISFEKTGSSSLVKVLMNGRMDEKSSFITNMIVMAMENSPCEQAIYDLSGMIFVEGSWINDAAIDCVLSLIGYSSDHGMTAALIIHDEFVREIFTDTLRSNRCPAKLTICSDQDMIGKRLRCA